ncbi:putative long-chain-fatty-acid--CoA ligase [Rosa chinensis]|uniref:Putative long-chain-fatty-acid--CoA ligase n=1 Tax=Rosa chinensis TaxID=74649 RepID=A0A2P6PND2_ROSCH|nr:putative long-chain-fatty-acid--CoA ligase [Rosa chinensis]
MMQPFMWVQPSEAMVSILCMCYRVDGSGSENSNCEMERYCFFILYCFNVCREIIVVYNYIWIKLPPMDYCNGGNNTACDSHAITYVPLYDTLVASANAVEFIINRAEVSIAFVQENKIPAIISILPNCSMHLKIIVSFTNVSATQKKEAEELGESCFLWEEFLQLGNSDSELRPKQRTAVCTIMYTSGTTGEPKGVIVTNAALMSEELSIDDVRFSLDNLQELKPTMFCGQVGKSGEGFATRKSGTSLGQACLTESCGGCFTSIGNVYPMIGIVFVFVPHLNFVLIWVYENSFKSFLVAVVVPDRKALEDWAAKHHLTDDYKSLCQNMKARKYILDELNSMGQKQHLRGFEWLKAVHLEPKPL